MQEQDVRNALVVLSSSSDQEFELWKMMKDRMSQACKAFEILAERKDAHTQEYRKVVEAYEETLSKQENKKKDLQQECAELQTKVVDIEKHLEKSRKQLQLIQERISLQMKEKEMLMISDENSEFEEKVEALSAEAKFLEVVSCIRWSTDDEKPHKIRGCLIEPHRPLMLEFDKREKSGFYICNKLWEMMEPDEEWKDLFPETTKCCADKNITMTVSVDNGQIHES